MIIAIQHIRTIAVALTLLAHLSFALSEPNQGYLSFIKDIGQFWGGVELFFVISGYLITRILVSDLWTEASRQVTTNNLKKFYIKRAARILPSAIFWALFILFFSWIYPESKFGTPSDNLNHFLASIFFFENVYLTYDIDFRFSVYWSLAIEEQFYLFFPILLLILRKKIILFLVVACLFQAVLDRPVSQANLLFMIRYDALMLGALIYFSDHYGWLNQIRQKLPYNHFVLVILGLALLGLVLAPVAFKNYYPVTFTDFFAALFVLISIIYAHSLGFAQSTISKCSLWLADRSYTIYLSHMPCFFLMHLIRNKTGVEILPSSLIDLRWFLCLAIVFTFSHICYQIIELPLRAKGRQLADRYSAH